MGDSQLVIHPIQEFNSNVVFTETIKCSTIII
jgi:hypothetical protein